MRGSWAHDLRAMNIVRVPMRKENGGARRALLGALAFFDALEGPLCSRKGGDNVEIVDERQRG